MRKKDSIFLVIVIVCAALFCLHAWVEFYPLHGKPAVQGIQRAGQGIPPIREQRSMRKVDVEKMDRLIDQDRLSNKEADFYDKY